MPQNGPKTRRILPAYQRIENDLRADIGAGRWAEGIMLPSRRRLAEQYAVSVPTVERAISELLSDGTLRADGGRGTFVAGRSGAAAPPAALPDHGADHGVVVGIIAGLKPREDGLGATSIWAETVTKSLERALTRSGASTCFFNLYSPDVPLARLEEAVVSLRTQGVSAIVVVLAGRPEDHPQAAAEAALRRIPLVFIADGKFNHPSLSVCYDNANAGYQAAHHLLERGCADLLFFAPQNAPWVQERLSGVRQAARLAGLPAEAVQSFVLDNHENAEEFRMRDWMEVGRDAARPLLAGGLTAHGVIGVNDNAALGFLRAASETGLTAGADYALIGFDDVPEARVAGLTTLHPPLEELGLEAARLALHAAAGHTTPTQICLHSHLIARASSKSPFSLQTAGKSASLPPARLTSPRKGAHPERVIHHETVLV